MRSTSDDSCLPEVGPPTEGIPDNDDAQVFPSGGEQIYHQLLPQRCTLGRLCKRSHQHNIQRWFGIDAFMTVSGGTTLRPPHAHFACFAAHGSRCSHACCVTQLTPLQTDAKPVGRSEACTLRSAAACGLAAIFESVHQPGWGHEAQDKSKGSRAPASIPAGLPVSLPIFVPVFGPQEDFWSGVACPGPYHVFFEGECAPDMSACLEVRRTLQVRLHPEEQVLS